MLSHIGTQIIDIEILILMFPIVFVFHEFEEIVGIKPWLTQNGDSLAKRFPILQKQLKLFKSLSTSAFAVAVFEEFLIVSIVTVGAVIFEWHLAWLAIFLAFSFHLLVHIIQWLIVRKYIPMIMTSLLCLPYCIYTFIYVQELFTNKDIITWFLFGLLFMIINLLFAHKLSIMFDKWITSQSNNHKLHI